MTLAEPVAAATEIDVIPAVRPTADGLAGNAASPEALKQLSKALRASPKARLGAGHLKAALEAVKAGDFHTGTQRALAALKMDERNGLAWHILAICREKAGDLAQALSAYDAALKLSPDESGIAHDLGRLAQRLGYLDIAEKLFLRMLTLRPGHIEATNNLACVQRDQNRYEDAIETLRALIQIHPESPILWNTLGTVLSDQGDVKAAMPFFDEALRLKPDFAKARYNRGNARQPMGDTLGALEDVEAARPGAESPYEAAMMEMARSNLLLNLGRVQEGFEAYEARLDPAMPDAMHVMSADPRWIPGMDLKGRRLLVIGEQGIADEMIFANVIPDLIEAVGTEGRLYLAVEPRLVELFQRSFPQAVVGGHRTVRHEGRMIRLMPFMQGHDPVDAWGPMASFLRQFRPSIDSFPDHDGYLRADPDRVARWARELEALGPGLKVGLHWKSLVLKGSRARYFSAFERWAPLLRTAGCRFVNLQCGDTAQDLAEAEAAGLEIWTPPFDLRNDLDDLAAMSCALDLVIGPGIAGTNIAAAVGARTWLIAAPDDWHRLGSDRYPFYPRVRLFETGRYDGWPEVIARMSDTLAGVARDGWNGD